MILPKLCTQWLVCLSVGSGGVFVSSCRESCECSPQHEGREVLLVLATTGARNGPSMRIVAVHQRCRTWLLSSGTPFPRARIPPKDEEQALIPIVLVVIALGMSGRLRLLAEQLKISILERNRLVSLSIDPSHEDEEEIQQSLRTLLQGIQSLDGNGTEYKSDAVQDEIMILKAAHSQLVKLYGSDEVQFEGQTVGLETTAARPYRDDPREELLPDRLRKSVRFTDTLIEADTSNGDLLQMQSQIMRDQDSSLESLSSSIGRQRELSIQIGDELDEHGELLDEVDSAVGRSSSRLDQAKNRLSTISRKAKEGSHLLTIVVLIIVLVLLLSIG